MSAPGTLSGSPVPASMGKMPLLTPKLESSQVVPLMLLMTEGNLAACQFRTTRDPTYAATAAALRAGADGVIFSRKYSEMRLANLAAGGRAVRESAG